jgi:hypothetical protein
MKMTWQWNAILALALMAGVGRAMADDSKGSGAKDDDSPKSIQSPPAGQGDGVEFQNFSIPPRLRDELSPQLVQELAKYQAASEKYLKDQKDLNAKLKGASSEERKKIRDQLRINQNDFLSDTRDLRNEIHKQIQDLAHRPEDRGKPGRPGGKPRH